MDGVSKSFGDQKLYESVNIKISVGEKVLICGENGCGKTTLVRMITGQMKPDCGDVYIDPTIKIAQLNQYENFDESLNVNQYIENIFQKVVSLEKELRSMEEKFPWNYSDSIINEYNEILDHFEALGGYRHLHQKKEFIRVFGFEDMLEKSIGKLSGGEQQYLRLAAVIYNAAPVLILDEPFTFLDHVKAVWLVSYLKSINKTVIIVSHDVYLVREFATDVISISNWRVKKFKNGYDSFKIESKVDQNKSTQINTTIENYIAEREASIQQRKEWMQKAENKHQHAVVIRRMERDIVKARGNKHVRKEVLEFDISKLVPSQTTDNKELLIQLVDVTKNWGSKRLLQNISLSIYEQEHYIFLGDNGTGKTTLLNLITKNIAPTNGEIIYIKKFVLSYLPQLDSHYDNHITTFKYISDFTVLSKKELEMAYSDYFECGFWDKQLSYLSGGEKKRLFLFSHLLRPFDILVLDEPTTFVDDNAKNKIIDMINSTEHCVIIVTHEPEVFNRVNGRKILLSNGNLQPAILK